MVDISLTQGALLLGGAFSAGLSGMVAVQVVVYFKLYPMDSSFLKTSVLFIWFLDMVHTIFTWTSIWQYLIVFFNQPNRTDFIPTSLSLTVAFTSILTFSVHCFYAHRLHLLSKKNWYLTSPIILLSMLRVGSAFATSAEMVNIQSFSILREKFWWLFSLGLAISSVVDILITFSFFFLLQRSRSSSLTLNHIINAMILYAFEIGILTCAGTVVSMICWLAMDDNLIFMGIHLVIGKLYANSMLATLNTRYSLRNSQRPRGHSPQPSFYTSQWRPSYHQNSFSSESPGNTLKISPVHIKVERSVRLSYDKGNTGHHNSL